MIKIIHNVNDNEHVLKIIGHAGKGKSDVCISVSALVTHLALNLPDEAFASLESGDTLISWHGCDWLWNPVEHTLKKLQESFPKEISYENGVQDII